MKTFNQTFFPALLLGVAGFLLLSEPPFDGNRALAADVDWRPRTGANSCSYPLALNTAEGLNADKTFTINTQGGGYNVLTMFVSFVDANGSVTRVDTTCTADFAGNQEAFTPQVCDDTSDGICVLTDAGKWRKTVSSGGKWVQRMDVEGLQDISCTISAGAGTAATIDTVTVTGVLCAN